MIIGHAYAGGIGNSKVTFDSVEDVNRDVGTWKLYGRVSFLVTCVVDIVPFNA